MYCTNCGQRLRDDAKHCPNCGMLIVREHEAESEADQRRASGQDPFTEYSYRQSNGSTYGSTYRSAAPQSKEDGYALTALILSLVSAVCCCMPVIGLPCAVIGIIFAIKGLTSKERHSMAVAALILSIIFTACNLVIIISVVISMANADTWADIISGFDFDIEDFSRFYR